MGQIKIYARDEMIKKNRSALSKAIHSAVVAALQYPEEKRFQRFISLEKENFLYPDDRSENYTIIEISLFAGRGKEAKKDLIRQLFRNIKDQCGISEQDVEITLFETPKENWGIRGIPGDELTLNYKVEV